MSTIPQINLEAETHVLHFQEWGWHVQLCKVGTATSIIINTPSKRGYSLQVDEGGNVIEHVSGDYTRIVEGSVVEYTGGATIQETQGPRVLRSADYTAISAPQLQLNPEEFKHGVPMELPSELKSY
jgi:hypothetical protein